MEPFAILTALDWRAEGSTLSLGPLTHGHLIERQSNAHATTGLRRLAMSRDGFVGMETFRRAEERNQRLLHEVLRLQKGGIGLPRAVAVAHSGTSPVLDGLPPAPAVDPVVMDMDGKLADENRRLKASNRRLGEVVLPQNHPALVPVPEPTVDQRLPSRYQSVTALEIRLADAVGELTQLEESDRGEWNRLQRQQEELEGDAVRVQAQHEQERDRWRVDREQWAADRQSWGTERSLQDERYRKVVSQTEDMETRVETLTRDQQAWGMERRRLLKETDLVPPPPQLEGILLSLCPGSVVLRRDELDAQPTGQVLEHLQKYRHTVDDNTSLRQELERMRVHSASLDRQHQDMSEHHLQRRKQFASLEENHRRQCAGFETDLAEARRRLASATAQKDSAESARSQAEADRVAYKSDVEINQRVRIQHEAESAQSRVDMHALGLSRDRLLQQRKTLQHFHEGKPPQARVQSMEQEMMKARQEDTTLEDTSTELQDKLKVLVMENDEMDTRIDTAEQDSRNLHNQHQLDVSLLHSQIQNYQCGPCLVCTNSQLEAQQANLARNKA
eukprot:gene8355-1492_t